VEANYCLAARLPNSGCSVHHGYDTQSGLCAAVWEVGVGGRDKFVFVSVEMSKNLVTAVVREARTQISTNVPHRMLCCSDVRGAWALHETYKLVDCKGEARVCLGDIEFKNEIEEINERKLGKLDTQVWPLKVLQLACAQEGTPQPCPYPSRRC
jgi:hypothetical protein